MRHRNHSNRLSQKPHIARMMLRNMLTSFLLYERIRTTKKRAQVLKPMIDRAVNMGRNVRKDSAIRSINALVTDENACRKILEVYVPRFEGRTSGYVRVVPVGMRKGDGAKLVDMVLVEGKDVALPEKSKKSGRSRKSGKNDLVATSANSSK